MRVLIAFEDSLALQDAFTALGHDAYSCGMIDMLEAIADGWDLIIANPPSTHTAVSGARWFKEKEQEQEDAIELVRSIMAANCPRICIMNPVSIISSKIRKPEQIIQPRQFGEEGTKKTCLWLKGLPRLNPWGDSLAQSMATQWGVLK